MASGEVDSGEVGGEMRGWLTIGAVLMTLMALGACTSPTSGSPTASPAPDTMLTILATDRTGKTSTWTLTCDPAGGDHPDPSAACQALADHGANALPPVPKDQACTEQYGGDETATITGTWRGQSISANLSRTNGCEINRWSALAGLLPATG